MKKKATLEVTFNLKLTALNVNTIIEAIKCRFKVTILN